MRPRALVVIPTYNEADNLERLVSDVRRELPRADILVVDDASPDGTGAIAAELSRSESYLQVLHRSAKLGIGTAYTEAFQWGLDAGYERFFQMDADFSHDARYLPQFDHALDAGANLVIGSRNIAGGGIRGWGPLRHVISKGGSWYSRRILGVDVSDLTTGYKAYDRRAIELMNMGTIQSNGYAFQIETTYRALVAGLRVVELPIIFVDRRAGRSKMSRHEVLEAAIGVWRMRSAVDSVRRDASC